MQVCRFAMVNGNVAGGWLFLCVSCRQLFSFFANFVLYFINNQNKTKKEMTVRLLSTMCAVAFVTVRAAAAQYSVYGLACEWQAAPLGIDAQQPRFGWKLQAQERCTEQDAYQVMVADSEERLAAGDGNVWNSGRVSSANSVIVDYGGKPLKPATTYYWRVQSWSRRGESSGWSRVARFTTGLPTEADWGGSRWIAMEKDGRKVLPGIHSPLVKRALGDEKTGMYRLPMLRKVVRVKKPVSQALAFVCGLGQFDMFVNGSKAGDHFLDRGGRNTQRKPSTSRSTLPTACAWATTWRA